MENKQELKKFDWKKVVKIAVDVIFYVIIAVLLVFSISNVKKQSDVKGGDEYAMPNVFGTGFMTVVSDSMAGTQKDSFTTNDLVLVKVVNDKNRDKLISKITVGTIITFPYYISAIGETALDSHRVVYVHTYDDGTINLVTLGDYEGEKYNITFNKDENLTPESLTDSTGGLVLTGPNANYFQVVKAESVKAIYSGKLTGWGAIFKFTQTFAGFFVVVVLPILAFAIYEIVLLVLAIKKMKDDKAPKETAEEMEARIRAEIAAQLAKEKEVPNEQSSSEQNTEEPGSKE